jgi:hypothetical protein
VKAQPNHSRTARGVGASGVGSASMGSMLMQLGS